MNSFASAGPSSVDDLYVRVLDALLEQHFALGSRFTEESLSLHFGARRSAVRQVLTRLFHEQVIVLRTHHRPQVAATPVEQTRQILQARRLAENTLVTLACQRASAAQVRVLREQLDGQRLNDQRGPAIRLSGEFHLLLAGIAGNAPLAHFLGSLVPLTSLAIARGEKDFCGWPNHERIVDAVEQRDIAAAVKCMAGHLDYLEAMLLNPQPSIDLHRVAG